MTQRDAVFQAVQQVLGNKEFNGAVKLEKSEKERVHQLLEIQFLSGAVEYRGEVTPDTIRKYVPGLVNNWLRKDPRLNGNTKYIPKNPGIRTGSGDETLKALKALLASTTDEDARREIQLEIDKRKAELKPKTEINVSAIPEHLRHLVPANAVVRSSSGESSEA